MALWPLGSSRPKGWNPCLLHRQADSSPLDTGEAQESVIEIVAQGIDEDFERTSHTALFSFPRWPGTLVRTLRRDFHRDFDVTKDKFSRGSDTTLGSLLSRYRLVFLGL